MEKVSLGDSGLMVSQFCLGCMRFGTATDAEMSYRILDMYVDAGGSFLDTANIYGRPPAGQAGDSERLLGRWMRERGNRSRMFVASKVGFPYPGIEQGTSARQIIEECEKSLRNLGVETVDLYYAHNDDRDTSLEESLEAFHRLVQQGKVRAIGGSNFRAWRLAQARAVSEANGWAAYCCVQQRHSYVRPKPGASFGAQVASNVDLRDYCASEGVRLLAYSPLLHGAYVRADREFSEQYRGPDTDARMATLRAVAEETGATLNQIVLAWMARSEPAVIPLVAASNEAQMAENLGALGVALSGEQIARLDGAGA